jgi:hypothetical protein
MYQQERASSRTRNIIAAIAVLLTLNYVIRLIPASLFVSSEFCLSLSGGRLGKEALQLCAWAEFLMVSLTITVLTALLILFAMGRDLVCRYLHGQSAGTLTAGIVAAMLLGWGGASAMPVGLAFDGPESVVWGTRAEGLPLPFLLGVLYFVQCGVLVYTFLHALEPQKMRRNHDAYCARRYGT